MNYFHQAHTKNSQFLLQQIQQHIDFLLNTTIPRMASSPDTAHEEQAGNIIQAIVETTRLHNVLCPNEKQHWEIIAGHQNASHEKTPENTPHKEDTSKDESEESSHKPSDDDVPLASIPVSEESPSDSEPSNNDTSSELPDNDSSVSPNDEPAPSKLPDNGSSVSPNDEPAPSSSHHESDNGLDKYTQAMNKGQEEKKEIKNNNPQPENDTDTKSYLYVGMNPCIVGCEESNSRVFARKNEYGEFFFTTDNGIVVDRRFVLSFKKIKELLQLEDDVSFQDIFLKDTLIHKGGRAILEYVLEKTESVQENYLPENSAKEQAQLFQSFHDSQKYKNNGTWDEFINRWKKEIGYFSGLTPTENSNNSNPLSSDV